MKVLVLVLSLSFSVTWSSAVYYSRNDLQCDLPSKSARFDCHPDPNPNTDNCGARGCCWQSGAEFASNNFASKLKSQNVRQGIPYCYFPRNYNGYTVSNVQQTDYGYRAILTRSALSGWPDDILKLTMDVWMETAKRLHFKVIRYKQSLFSQMSQMQSHTCDCICDSCVCMEYLVAY